MVQPLAQVLQKRFLLLLRQQFDSLLDLSKCAHAGKMPDFLRGVNAWQGGNKNQSLGAFSLVCFVEIVVGTLMGFPDFNRSKSALNFGPW